MCYDPSEETFGAVVIKVDNLTQDELRELGALVENWSTRNVGAVHEVQITRDRDAKYLLDVA